ncbi:MAG: DUF488 domain-containing protein [Planctomycetota bacterium]|jgi:uncharacterized protein (DUF488 family)
MGLKPSPAERTVWTLGHSNHPLERFLDLLKQHQITLLLDVRSSPYSRYASQFNKEAICNALKAQGVDYLFLGDLLGGIPSAGREDALPRGGGAWPPHIPTTAEREDGQFYDPEGYVLYDRLAQSPQFQQGVERLLEKIGTARAALMCGEEDPTDCHRRLLVGRVLGTRGVTVLHIRGDGRIQSEQQVAQQQWFRQTKGQLTLFDMEEPQQWKSTRSALPRKAPPSSSQSSSEPESGG